MQPSGRVTRATTPHCGSAVTCVWTDDDVFELPGLHTLKALDQRP